MRNGTLERALRSEFVRHSALVFGAMMAANALNYVFNFAVSRKLGVENFATLAALGSGIMIFSLPATVVNLIVVKYAAEFHAVGDRARLSRLSRVVLRRTAVFAAAFLICGILLRGIVANFLHISNDIAIVLTIVLLSLSFIMPSVRGILQGAQNFRTYAVSSILEVFLKVVFGAGLVYAGFGVGGAMLGWCAALATALAYTMWAVRTPSTRFTRSGQALFIDLARLFKTISGVAAATAALTLLSFGDVFLVKHYLDAHQAGLYAAVNLTGKVVLMVVSFLPMVLLPKAVAKVSRGESATGLLLQAGAGTLVISGVVLTWFALMPVGILNVLAGHAFAPAAPYVFRYDIVMLLLAGITLVVNYKIALHRFDFVYPLFAVLIAEVVAIAFRHRGIVDVINILLAGNAIALMAVLYRVNAAAPAGARLAFFHESVPIMD